MFILCKYVIVSFLISRINVSVSLFPLTYMITLSYLLYRIFFFQSFTVFLKKCKYSYLIKTIPPLLSFIISLLILPISKLTLKMKQESQQTHIHKSQQNTQTSKSISSAGMINRVQSALRFSKPTTHTHTIFKMMSQPRVGEVWRHS